MSRLRVFGCLAYALQKGQRRAMEPKAEVRICMGYSGAGYMIWVPHRGRFLDTAAVVFNEDAIARKARTDAIAKYHYQLTDRQLKITDNLQNLATDTENTWLRPGSNQGIIRNLELGETGQDGNHHPVTPPASPSLQPPGTTFVTPGGPATDARG